ncbi:hydroxyisourate hydrolase, partial [Pseudomonas sp. CCI4.2]
YYRARGTELPDQAFLDVVVLRFGIDAAQDHYHVPLLISPYSYSTYRGS